MYWLSGLSRSRQYQLGPFREYECVRVQGRLHILKVAHSLQLG